MSVETATPVGVEDRIATELSVAPRQVRAAVDLLDGGSTVPFVARYRKEATGGLDDVQLRTLAERLEYLRELEARRGAVLESIESQGKLTDDLRAQVLAAETKSRLEDVYLPYKPRRRTKAQIAREAGLEPLAGRLLADPSLDPDAEAAGFVVEGVGDAAAALDGARAILVERFSEDADLIGELRERMWKAGAMSSSVRDGKDEAGRKYSDYFALTEAFTAVKSHRVLAMLRGEREDVLSLEFAADREDPAPGTTTPQERAVAARFGVSDQGRPADRFLLDCVRLAWRARILTHLALDTRSRLRTRAEEDAVAVFAANLRDLLLAAPAGARTTLGLDPGLRTGVKVAVVDGTGKVVATDTIYPHEPRRKWDESRATLRALVETHGVDLVAIGNGTASRETDKLARELAASLERPLTTVVVSEAGASVYSASEYASRELPDLDVSIRGAVSIARRLQDPLAELVKIDPRSIGVGQYQHDLPQGMLAKSLEAVVEDCVNAVGVDVNTASGALLRQVSGIGEALAANIVTHRDEHGPFGSREELRKVPLLGAKAFEQSAGFLRIAGGTNPLDGSGVHPEAYPVAERIAAAAGVGVAELIGSPTLRSLDPSAFVDGTFGLPTVQDILAELDKPGRDPRPSFRAAAFADGVEKISDLAPGMVLEGVVTNVAAFGAFVDVGVHQDGLVHVSALSNRFVEDPREVARPGDVVRVKVLEVDEARKRISLTMKLQDDAPGGAGRPGGRRPDRGERTEGERPAGGRRGRGRRPSGGGKPAPAAGARGNAAPGAAAPGAAAPGAAGTGVPGAAGAGVPAAAAAGGTRAPAAAGKAPADRRGGGPRPGRGGAERQPSRDEQRDDRGGRRRPAGESGGRRTASPDTAMADAMRRAGLL